MAVVRPRPGHTVDAGPLVSGLRGCSTYALFKSRDLEVIRLVRQAEHSHATPGAAGEITVRGLDGHVLVCTAAGPQGLLAGPMLLLPQRMDHDLRAIESASALATRSLR